MKKLILTVALAAFASATAVQAGEQCCKEKAACDSKAKTAKSAKKADGSTRGAQLLVKR